LPPQPPSRRPNREQISPRIECGLQRWRRKRRLPRADGPSDRAVRAVPCRPSVSTNVAPAVLPTPRARRSSYATYWGRSASA